MSEDRQDYSFIEQGGLDYTSRERFQYYDLRIKGIIQETADARSFIFDIAEELLPLFEYQSGQFLTFKIPFEGMDLVRCYSLASSPILGEPHRVTVKKISGGRVSHWMNERLQIGDRLKVMPPLGKFVLGGERGDGNDIYLFSGGSGITPVISILKTALVSSGRRVRFLYANRDRESIIFRDDLDQLQRAYPDRLRLVHRLDVIDGFLTRAVVREFIDGQEESDFYMCGPGPFMDIVEETLAEAGIRREKIFIERFLSPPDPEEVIAEGDGKQGEIPESITVDLYGTEHQLDYTEGMTILQTGFRAGINPPFSCESGFCAACRARLLEGEVHMLNNEVLSDSELRQGYVLTCQSLPTTRVCSVRYE